MIVMVNARLFNPASVYYDRFQGGKQGHLPKTKRHRIERLRQHDPVRVQHRKNLLMSATAALMIIAAPGRNIFMFLMQRIQNIAEPW